MTGYNTTIILQILFLCGLGAIAGILITQLFRQPKVEHTTALPIPNPFNVICWLEKEGNILWSNDAYKVSEADAASAQSGLALFELSGETQPNIPFRGSLKSPGKTEIHYELIETQTANGSWFIAKGNQTLVETEAELKRFVQTLADTFSHLPTGLAIFDKHRDLSLFNPALSEILNLGPEWLATRPSLEDCLNKMHINGLLPEPKDFKRWRDAFGQLGSSTTNESYQEDWHLPDLRVLRVTARPHLDQATALMIDDITGRVRVEQKYRGELEHVFSALDCISHSIIVFDAAGEMAFANSAFDELWGHSISESFTPTTIEQLCIGCSDKFAQTQFWSELVDFGERHSKGSQMKEIMSDQFGRQYEVIASSISGGRVMCEFLPLCKLDQTQMPPRVELLA